MIVVKIELWPKGDKKRARLIGSLFLRNDGTGTTKVGNYEVIASHAGIYLGKRPEPYKTASVKGFPRSWSPYRLLHRALKALGEIG